MNITAKWQNGNIVVQIENRGGSKLTVCGLVFDGVNWQSSAVGKYASQKTAETGAKRYMKMFAGEFEKVV